MLDGGLEGFSVTTTMRGFQLLLLGGVIVNEDELERSEAAPFSSSAGGTMTSLCSCRCSSLGEQAARSPSRSPAVGQNAKQMKEALIAGTTREPK